MADLSCIGIPDHRIEERIMKKDIDEIAKAHGAETIITPFTPNVINEYFRTTIRNMQMIEQPNTLILK